MKGKTFFFFVFFLNEFMENARKKWRQRFGWNECLIKGDLPSSSHNKWSLVKLFVKKKTFVICEGFLSWSELHE